MGSKFKCKQMKWHREYNKLLRIAIGCVASVSQPKYVQVIICRRRSIVIVVVFALTPKYWDENVVMEGRKKERK